VTSTIHYGLERFDEPSRLTPIQLPHDFGWIKADDTAQFDELYYVNAALAGLQMRNPGLIDPELFGQIDLTQTSFFPKPNQHIG
jgi:hypothetical protein